MREQIGFVSLEGHWDEGNLLLDGEIEIVLVDVVDVLLGEGANSETTLRE